MANLYQPVAVDRNRISVSGLSAGAFMAHQLHLAYSDIFCGAGLIAGGPFMASQGTLWGALAYGMHGLPAPDAHKLGLVAKSFAAMGALAPLENLKKSRVWVFHGLEDDRVQRSVSESLVRLYQQFVDPSGFAYIKDVDVGHAMPTDACEPIHYGDESYIANCGYDAAGALLSHIHGPLAARKPAVAERLFDIDQSEFRPSGQSASMHDFGYIYLPEGALAGRRCGVHVALHGCRQHRDAIDNTFALRAGYNEWAEANDIIVLYPQACPMQSHGIYNPLGSWDWWSFTGADYALRSGVQMRAIVGMVQSLGALDD